MVRISRVRQLVARRRYSITRHAVLEALADGLQIPSDVLRPLRTGRIIEQYRERDRALILGYTGEQRPVHTVVEIAHDTNGDEHLWLVTVYVPDESEWEPGWTRRR